MTDSPPPRRTRSGSQKRRRSFKASLALNEEERALLTTLAERAGMTDAGYMRHQCFGTAAPRAVRRPPIERTLLAQLLGHLGKCGSNVNQIAHALNAGGEPPADLAVTLAELRAASADISRALGRRES